MHTYIFFTDIRPESSQLWGTETLGLCCRILRGNAMFNPFVNTSISAGFLTLILATPADAALIGGDWQTTGDGLMIRDTTTNLEWLKLTETAGMSYGGVSG
ncbi:MAG: hypothetical protein K8I04_10780, partial [Gammaproteobacteria bacterium]|nr:hypothetical protein [Gammaproteobacteria bacterium]